MRSNGAKRLTAPRLPAMFLLLLVAVPAWLAAQDVAPASLTARRAQQFAASPLLEAGVVLHQAHDTPTTAVMALAPVSHPRLEHAIGETIRTVPLHGVRSGHTVQADHPIWLINLEPIGDYVLVGELRTGRGTIALEPLSIAPGDLGEETPNGGEPSGGLLRLRFRIDGSLQADDAEIGAGDDSFVSSRTLIDAAELPPAGEYREFDVYTVAPGNGFPEPFTQGVTSAGISVSSVDPGRLQWMKTLERAFSTSPYTTGWEIAEWQGTTPDEFIRCVYTTDFTARLSGRLGTEEWSPNLPRRVHGLTIETRNAEGQRGGWHLVNLFRAPETDEEKRAPGNQHPGKSLDLRNRLLRFDLVLSASVPGDGIPSIVFTLEEDGIRRVHRIEELRESNGEPLPAGAFQSLSIYMHPMHNRTARGGATPSRRIDFRFEIEGAAGTGEEPVSVTLQNLIVHETPIANLPSGYDLQRLDEESRSTAGLHPWPAVSTAQLDPADNPVYIRPMIPGCGDAPREDPSYYLADHTLFIDERGHWNLYGIYNTPTGFVPVETDGTSHPNAPYNAGLIHAVSCTPNVPLNTPHPHLHGTADFRGAAFAGPERRTRSVFVDPDQPVFFFGPWAPAVVRAGNEFIMFFNEHSLGHPLKNRGFGYAVSSTPWSPPSWKFWQPASENERLVYTLSPHDISRDIDFCTVHSGDDPLHYAVWVGYKAERHDGLDSSSAKVLAKHVSGDPRRIVDVPGEEEYVVYREHNPDSGRVDSDSESPSLVHDPQTGVFYLKVTKNGTTYPGHAFLNDLLVLESGEGALLLGERTRGDRSHLVGGGVFIDPVGMIPLESIMWQPAMDLREGTFHYRYRVVVVDRADASSSRPARLLEIDCIDGHIRPIGFSMLPGEGLVAPTSADRLAQLYYQDREWTAIVVADEGNGEPAGGFLYMARWPSQQRGDPIGERILEGITRPRALHIEQKGLAPARAVVGSPDQRNAFRAEAVHHGVRATAAGGDVILRFQHPLRPNSPLQTSFFMLYPDQIGSIMLETNERGETVSTVAEVIEAIANDPIGSNTVRLTALDDAFLDGKVEPQTVTLHRGVDRRLAWFAADDPNTGETSLWQSNLIVPEYPGHPQRVAGADWPWQPVALLRHNNDLLILDAQSAALFQVDIRSGPAMVRRDSPLVEGLDNPTALLRSENQIYVAFADGVYTLDLSIPGVLPIMTPSRGRGHTLAGVRGLAAVNWIVESIGHGSRVYWSQLDPESGRIQPFTADRYIGHLPIYAGEIHHDPFQPAESDPWFISANETNRDGGYSIRRLLWQPPLTAPSGTVK